jgi:outer membrane protein TolC
MQTRRETLYQEALSLHAVRRDYGTQLSGTMAYVLSGHDNGNRGSTASLSLDASRILPTGGTLSLSADEARDTARAAGGTNTTASRQSAGIRLDQPLLAGAGHAASHETMLQAERTFVYAIRTFALERQDAAIAVLSGFFELLIHQNVLGNTRLNAEQSRLLRQRTEALFRIRRAPAIDVMRAEQQELSASNLVALTEADFDTQVRTFLLTLGVPVDTPVRVRGDVPAVVSQAFSLADATRLAVARRLDLQTARDRVTDADRKVAVARSNLLPELSAYGQATWSGSDDSASGDTRDTAYEAGVTLQLPLDRRDERDALRLAQLNADQAARSAREQEDRIRLEVASDFSQIEYLTRAVLIAERSLAIAEKRADNARFRFRNGELENRDVVEAENELLNARNALVRAQADHEVQRIRLLRNVGLIDVDSNGNLVAHPQPIEKANP